MAEKKKEKMQEEKPEPKLTPIARRIEAYRQNLGYTQEQIAPLIGYTSRYYSKVINSEKIPKKFVKKVAGFHKVPVERFYEDQELDFSAPLTTPILRANDTNLLDAYDLNPPKIDEAYLLSLLRALPEEYTFATIEFVQNLYQNRNKKKDEK